MDDFERAARQAALARAAADERRRSFERDPRARRRIARQRRRNDRLKRTIGFARRVNEGNEHWLWWLPAAVVLGVVALACVSGFSWLMVALFT